MSTLPRQLDRAVKEELRSMEVIKWVGQPMPFRRMISAFGLWFFFVPWTAFSIFWIHGAIKQEEAGSIFPLFGLPFLLIGVVMLLSPFWQYFKSTKTAYVVTNKRAFTLELVRGVSIKNYYPDSIGYLEKKVRPDGIGNLILNIEHYKDSDGDSQTKEHGFFAIKKVNEAELAIENMIASNA